MKAITILAAAVIGTFLGTGIGIAQAASEPAPSPAQTSHAHQVTHEDVTFVKEVTITVPKRAPHAVTGGHVRPLTMVCSVETLSHGSGTVRYCR